VRPPGLPNVRMILVGDGSDAADDWIGRAHRRGDLCVTSDVPLASRCLAKGASVVAPERERVDRSEYRGALAGRELSRHLRELGMKTRGARGADQGRPIEVFDALDTAVHKALRETLPHPA